MMLSRRAFLLGTSGCLLANLPLAGWASGTASGGRSFLEVFAFTCPHCYQLALQLRLWLPLHPHVTHYPVHIISTADDLKLAAAGYAAALLGQGEAYRQALFKAIHTDKRPADEKTLVAVAESLGLASQQLVQTMQGAEVAELLARSERITRQFQITATPTLVIDLHSVRLPERDPLDILQEAFGP